MDMMENGGFGVSGFCKLYRTVHSALRVVQHGPQDVRAALEESFGRDRLYQSELRPSAARLQFIFDWTKQMQACLHSTGGFECLCEMGFFFFWYACTKPFVVWTRQVFRDVGT